MSPFNATRYARLLEGLEISEVRSSELEFSGRLDAEYYQPAHLQAESLIANRSGVPLSSVAEFLIGPFGSAFTVENYCDDRTYRYIRGKDVKPMTISDEDNVYMPKADYDRLGKYALKAGDVLVSVVGTIGSSALVEPQHLPAIFSCKSTAIRTRAIDPRYLISYLNSSYGRSLLIRKERGAVQKGLNLDDLRTLSVFVAGQDLQRRIAKIHEDADQAKSASKTALALAEQLLLQTLHLSDWQAPETLSYVRQSIEAFAAGRLDAEYFSPRVQALMKLLGRDGLTIGQVAPARHEVFDATKAAKTFTYIEIGDMRADGTVEPSELDVVDAPSRATQHVRAGDVLTSTVRPIRRLSAAVDSAQDGAVCSSGFVVLQPRGISSATLVTYLRLPLFCELMDLHTSASLYPAISEKDLLGLPIPSISISTQTAVDHQVAVAHLEKLRARKRLDAAKRAVEIAIEDSESAALKYLEPFK